MKNIKVNMTNDAGVRSSTTINFTICEAYYKVASGLAAMPPNVDISTYCHASQDDYIKGIAAAAQLLTNQLCTAAMELGYKGVNQYHIESNMLERVIHQQDF